MVIDDPVLLESHRNILFMIMPGVVIFVVLLFRYFRHKKDLSFRMILFFGLYDAIILMTPFFPIIYIGVTYLLLVLFYLYENYIFFGWKKLLSSLLYLPLNIFVIYLIVSFFAAILGVPE